MVSTIVGIISAILVLTGCGFYFIPKYAMSTTNAWITAIDTSIGWIGANWIVFTIIVVLLVIAVFHTIGLFKKRR